MLVEFLVAGQWQGSGSTRALHLSDGAEAIRGDLPVAHTTTVDIPHGAGESLGSGVRRLSSLQSVRDRMAEALAHRVHPVVTVGGDCGVELAAVSHAHARHPDDLALVWFDAHPDLNTPESSTTGAFHGMVLRSILGDGLDALAVHNPLAFSHVILAGTRAADEAEAELISSQGIRILPPDQLNARSLVQAITDTGAQHVYLHIDFDVLDPAEFTSIDYPEPFGVTATALLDSIRAVTSHFTLAGAGLCEFAPRHAEAAADDLPSILRIIGALTT